MKKYFRFLGFLIVLLSAGYIFLVHTVMPSYLRQLVPQVEAMADDYINGSVSIGELTWNGGLSAEIDNVVIKDANGSTVAELPRTIVHLRPWMALDKGARAVSKIELMRPKAYLVMNDNEQWNMQHLLKPSDSEETPFYGLLEITGGSLRVATPEGQWDFGVDGTLNGGANPKFGVDVQLTSGTDRLGVSGLLTSKGEGRLQVKGDKLALAAYGALAKRYAGLDNLQGGLGKFAVLYVNENAGNRFSGEAALNGLQASVTAAGEQHSITLNGSLRARDNMVSVRELDVGVDGQKLRVEGEADLRDIEAPQGEGVITADSLAYGGYEAAKLRLPFRADKENIILDGFQAEYGGGSIKANGAYSIKEQVLTADAQLQNITHHMPDKPEDDIHLNAKLAVLAKALQDKVELHAAADTLDLRWRSLTINKMALDGALNEAGLIIDHFSAFAGNNGSLAVHGSVTKDGTLDLQGRMADFPVNPLLDIAAGQEASGLCSTGFAIGGRLTAPEFSGMVQLTQAEFLKQKIDEAHGFISLKDNVLTIKNLVANMEQGRHLLDGSIDLRGEEPAFELSLETQGVRIEPIMQFLAPDASVTGNLDNIMQLSGTVSHPSVYGEVHATDGSAAKQLFNSVSGRYIYEDGRLELRNFLIQAFLASIKLDGVMTADQRLDFNMDAKNVDLAHLPIKDETVDLDGLLDAKGHLGGVLSSPTFTGDIASEKIYINGEVLTELQGTLDSNAKEKNIFQVSFKQPYKDDPLNYGIYSADINIDTVQRFVQGKVLMAWGDIGGLLRMARQDYDINGQMQGEMNFNPQGKGSGISIAVNADDVKIHELNYAHMNFNGHLQNGIVSFDNVKLQEQKDVNDRGLIVAGGQMDLRRKSMDMALSSVKANPAVVTAVMKDPPEIKGEMDMTVKLGGTIDDPQGTGSLEIVNGSVAGVSIDRLTAMLSLNNDNIHLQQFSAVKDAYGVKAEGDIPLDLFRSREQRRNPQAQMNIIADLNEARMGILPAMTKMVEWGVGDTQGQVRLAGTLEEPLLFGSLKITEGAMKLKYIDTVLENINLDVDFNGNTVLLRDLSTKLGKGTLAAEGSYALNTAVDTGYSLHITAKDAEIASQIFTGRINSDVTIEPQRYRDFRRPRSNNAPPPIAYRPLVKGSVRLDDVLVNMPTIPELGEGESNLGLDMRVDLGRKIHLYNNYLYDIWLAGGIQIKGSSNYPQIDGTIQAEKGSITYLRTDFKLNKASLNWIEPGSFLPNVNLESTARFSRYNIFMKINGPVENMDLQLQSDPPMERNTIIRMLTLQRDTAGSNEVTSEDMNNLMTVGLQMTVLGDVETLIKQTLGLDQFRIYTGKVRSGIGFESAKDRTQELTTDERNQYNVLVSKYLNDKLMIGYTTSFDALDRSIFGQYDISRHMNITYSRSYDTLERAEDWYGLEYKISF